MESGKNNLLVIVGHGRPSISTTLLAALDSAPRPDVIMYQRRPDPEGFKNHGAFYRYPRVGKPARKAQRCALPGCPYETTHNGGYCCADHCREHQRQRSFNVRIDRPE
jgi:hypothetical protein